MKKLILLILFISFGMISHAHALSIGDALYLGTINDGIPSSEAAEAGYINDLITLASGAGDTVIGTETYNRVSSSLVGPFPTALEAGAVKQDGGNTSYDATGFLYVLGKYDAASAGSLVWYNATGFTGNVTLPSTFNGLGLSHTTGFNPGDPPPGPGPGPIPEPTTMLLFGTGLIGLAGLSRRKKK